nr:MGMT family protein [uncultured Holophaga sp.]
MCSWTAFETDLIRPGWILLGWTRSGLSLLRLCPERPEVGSTPPPAWVAEAIRRIQAFLAGSGHCMEGIPMDLGPVTPFHRQVLEVLRRTRQGQTLTYGEVALLAGSPRAARAVGQAVARNPLPILIPCHRVVAAQGPGGFSLFGSLECKRRLLALEGVHLA